MTKPAQIKVIIKRYLKWYIIPLIYFLATSLPCAYAWYTRPIAHRPAINAVFNKIALNPTLMITALITVWIIIAVLFVLIASWLKIRFPKISLNRGSTEILQKEAILQKSSSDEKPKNFWSKTLNVSSYVLGIILIVAGLSIALWVSKPYITFLFSTSKIEALEKKAELIELVRSDAMRRTVENRNRSDALQKFLMEKAEFAGQVQENWIIIPTALVDAPILEGINLENLALGVCHISDSAAPGQGGNCIIEGHNLGEFGWWRPEGPFNMLEILEQGIRIYVFYNGKKYVYRVKEKKYTDIHDPKLYDFSQGERLTLITCTSTWNPTIYTEKRTVIVAYPE